MGFFGPNIKKMKANKDVEGLIEALKHKDGAVRREAAEALGEIGDARAMEPLIQALKDKDTWLQWCAAEALGKIGDARAVEPLIRALKDRWNAVRRGAAEALGEIGDARAVEPLIQALKDKDELVRRCAAEALGKIKDARAVEPLIEALKGQRLGGSRARRLGPYIAHKAVEAATDKQASNIVLLDVRKVCSFADYFVICNGDSERQISTIYDEVGHRLKREGILPHHHEGTVDSGWLLLDFGDTIVHIFASFEREYYQLDELWNQAVPVLRIQ